MLNIRSLSNKFYSQKNKKKWMRQRVTRGFADVDIWNMDMYLLDLLPAMLKQHADNTHGWPQSEQFPEFEDWTNYLHNITNKFIKAKDLLTRWDGISIDEMIANDKEAAVLVKEAMSELGEHFFNLWD